MGDMVDATAPSPPCSFRARPAGHAFASYMAVSSVHPVRRDNQSRLLSSSAAIGLDRTEAWKLKWALVSLGKINEVLVLVK